MVMLLLAWRISDCSVFTSSSFSASRVENVWPADTFLDSNPLGDRSSIFAQDRLFPVWFPSPATPIGKNPVICLLGGAPFSPLQKIVGKERMNGYRLLR